jgi:3D (Asp-Asp-Asp) domain-containing protein
MAFGSNTFAPVGASVQTALCDEVGNAMLIKFATANKPSTKAGYAVGCIGIDTTTGATYVNVGTIASCSFVSISTGPTGDLILADNDYISFGTTTTTPATKVTLTFDKAVTGIGQFKIGDLSTAQVLNTNPGSGVAGSAINILHSAGPGDCDDLIGSYAKVAVGGAGDSGLTLVGSAPRAYINAGTASAAYGCQPWAKHLGTGTVTAMSGLSAALILNDAEAFTATNSINAGHFHVFTVAGAANGTVTSGNFDGIMVEVYPNVTGLGSMLHLAQDGTTVIGAAIKIGGTKITNILDVAVGDGAVVGAGTYSTADGYLVIKVGANTYRIPFFTAVD